MERFFVDTSAWLAQANRADSGHEAVSGALASLPGRLVTPNLIFSVTVTLARYRLGHSAALALGGALRDPDRVDIVRLTREDENAAWELFQNRADKEYSFTDCTSFVVMRRLGVGTTSPQGRQGGASRPIIAE